MTQTGTCARSPGIRVSADGLRVGAVYGLQCPALGADMLDVTPLNAGWRAQRPTRRTAGDLRLTMLLKSDDAGQARLLDKYRALQPLTLRLSLPGGQGLGWQGYVRSLALTAAHPDAPITLEATVSVSGEAEVSE